MTMTENDNWAFGDWWSLLNNELAERSESEAGYGDARYHYNANYSPMTAAQLIKLNRDDQRLEAAIAE